MNHAVHGLITLKAPPSATKVHGASELGRLHQEAERQRQQDTRVNVSVGVCVFGGVLTGEAGSM